MMNRIVLVVCAFAIAIGIATAQERISAKGAFQVDVDFARFRGDSDWTYIEMYYGIQESMLSYRRDSGRYAGAANVTWEIRRDTGVVARKEWTIPHIVEDTSQMARAQTLMGVQSVGLPAGDYTSSVVATDVGEQARKDSFAVPFRITTFPAGRELLSDVEFCTSIQSSSNKKSIFYKNTLEVIPNASKLYGVGLPILYYYAEAYNLFDHPRDSNFTVRTEVVDAMGKDVFTKDRTRQRLRNSSVEVGQINLSTMRGGTYTLRLSLLDSANAIPAAVAQKKFFVYKPSTLPDTTAGASYNLARNDFIQMTDVELNNEFAKARYTATDAERKQWELLSDVTTKQKFLTEFWLRRDLVPTTPENEFRDEYNKRVAYADEHYTIGNRNGWGTDRGRVYVIYGNPDEIERFPSSSESSPYEVWHYNALQGGVIFVFVDRTGFGDYILVHSTYRDEIHDEQWYQHYAQKMQ